MPESHRYTWNDLPAEVRGWVENVLGAPVISAITQPGGFSHAVAQRLETASGRVVFLKMVNEQINSKSGELARAEEAVLSQMPKDAPVPRFIASYDASPWVGLLSGFIEGVNPVTPWSSDELDRVLEALDLIQKVVTPCPIDGLPTIGEQLRDDAESFARVLADRPDDLEPWVVSRLPELVTASRRAIDALAGDTLVHLDLRADNLLIDADERIWLVDWSWGCRGARWADAVIFLTSIAAQDEQLDIGGWIDRVLIKHGVDPSVGTDVLVWMLGFFTDSCRKPELVDMPTLRAKQRRYRDDLLPLVQRRWKD